MDSSELKLIPVNPNKERINKYLKDPFFEAAFIRMTNYYQIIGYEIPWVGYFAEFNNRLIGVGGIKGKPQNNKVEISYGTYPGLEKKGIGTMICKKLVDIARQKLPGVQVIARTLEADNASTSILKKNHFSFVGKVMDEKYGLVWEWEYEKKK